MVWPRFVWREIGVGRTLSGWYQRVYIHCSLFKDYAIPKMGIRELEVEEDPLIRWIHQLVSSGGLILLSLNYQHKGTKTTVTLLAHMSHHPLRLPLPSLAPSSSRLLLIMRCLPAPSATWLRKRISHMPLLLSKRIYRWGDQILVIGVWNPINYLEYWIDVKGCRPVNWFESN